MDVREKLVELLWEYDQMRMMRMSIEECVDRLIPKGLTVRKCENDTKCSDFEICLYENEKEKTERIVDLMASFYGVDPGYYGVEAYPLASHLISHGVTVQEWISVKDRLPTIYDADADNCVLAIHKASNKRYYHWRSVADNPFDFAHWMKTPQPPKGE